MCSVSTVSELLERYIEAKRPSWRPRTLADTQTTVQRYLLPHLGYLQLHHLSSSHIESLLARYQHRRRTALRIYRTLSAACRLAVRRCWMDRNPCEELDPPAYKPEARRMWTLDELRAFLSGSRHHPMYTLWLTAVSTGCRPGELLALTWADVSVDLCALRICKSVQVIRGQEVITPPKTATG